MGQSICLAIVDQDCTTTIIVKVGDTCLKIAAANNLTLIVLRMNNPQLNKACDIYVGEVRCVFVFLSYHLFGFYILVVNSGLWTQTQSIEPS